MPWDVPLDSSDDELLSPQVASAESSRQGAVVRSGWDVQLADSGSEDRPAAVCRDRILCVLTPPPRRRGRPPGSTKEQKMLDTVMKASQRRELENESMADRMRRLRQAKASKTGCISFRHCCRSICGAFAVGRC